MPAMNTSHLHIVFGFSLMFLGGLSGAAIGLRFHLADWAGGYTSFRRRLLRLGHIAFFGLGILNVLFALSVDRYPLATGHLAWASAGFFVAGLGMPVICLLSAWREPFRHLFAVPVLGVFVGVGSLVAGWMGS